MADEVVLAEVAARAAAFRLRQGEMLEQATRSHVQVARPASAGANFGGRLTLASCKARCGAGRMGAICRRKNSASARRALRAPFVCRARTRGLGLRPAVADAEEGGAVCGAWTSKAKRVWTLASRRAPGHKALVERQSPC